MACSSPSTSSTRPADRRPSGRAVGRRRRVEPRGRSERHRTSRRGRRGRHRWIISSDVGLATSRVAEEPRSRCSSSRPARRPSSPSRAGTRSARACRPPRWWSGRSAVRAAGRADQGRAIIADYAGAGDPQRRWRRSSAPSRASSCRSRWRPCPSRTSRRTCATSGVRPDLLVATGHPLDQGRSPCSRRISVWTSRRPGRTRRWRRSVSGAADAAIGRYSDFDCADYQSDEYQELARATSRCPTTRSWRTTPSPATASCRWSPRRSRRPVTTCRRSPSTSTADLRPARLPLRGQLDGRGELAAAQPLFSVIGEARRPAGSTRPASGTRDVDPSRAPRALRP